MDRYLTEFSSYLQENDKGAQTIRTYNSVLQSFIDWYVGTAGEFTPSTVTSVQLQDYRSYMQTVENKKPATVNKTLATLKSFFTWTTEVGYTTSNAALKVKMKRVQEPESPKWLTEPQQNRLLDVIDTEKNEWKRERDRAIIHTMLFAGLRVDEVSNLRLQDIDMKADTIIVFNGKGGKWRVVPLNAHLKKVYKSWLQLRTIDTSNSIYLFVSERSGHMTTRAIGYTVNKYLVACGLVDVTEGAYQNGNRRISKERGQISCHSLRHTFCKNLVNKGVSIQQVAKLAGHSSLEVTRRYVEPGADELHKAVNLL